MAKNDPKSTEQKKPANVSEETGHTQEEIDEFAAEGFQKVSTSVLYFKPSSGASFTGIPLVRQEREQNIDPTKKGFFYLVVATKAGKAANPGGDMVDYEPGEILHVDERWACQALKPLLPHVRVDEKTGEERRSRYIEVKVVAEKQVPTSKPGQKVWIMKIGQKPATPKTLAIAAKVDHVALLGYTPPEVDEEGNPITPKALTAGVAASTN